MDLDIGRGVRIRVQVRDRVKREDRPGLLDHERDAVRGVIEVDRQVGRPGPEHGQAGHDHVHTARQRQRDDLFRLDALGDQVVSQAVRARVEFGIGQSALSIRDRGPGRRALGLRRDEVRDGLRGHRVVGVGPLDEQAVPFRFGQQTDLAERPVGLGAQRTGELDEAFLLQRQGFRVVEIRVGVELQQDAVAAVDAAVGVEDEVLHRPGLHDVPGGGEVTELRLPFEQHDVHDGAEQVAAAAGHAELAVQDLHRVELVAQYQLDLLRHLVDEVGEAGLRGDPHA
ncbi:hypothetical protein Lesp02_07120 [Lentzea sp. NBRC 105346]|nr:hypothetical protein Lesp02_07120 [Lentzea sp. NBRC 105346]